MAHTPYTPAADEKLSLVMAYTQNGLVRGQAVTKESVRVSTWLRTDGAPEYIRLIQPQLLILAGGQVKTSSCGELLVPASQVLGFHLMPPAQDPPDYDESERNRAWVDVTVMITSFLVKGKVRISAQTGFVSSISTSRVAWMSVYEADISNPIVPQMGHIQVPMLVVRPNQVSFALDT